jgi:sugar/nucleoside kinase (ribokinase family)
MTRARIVVAGDVVDDVIAVVDQPVRSNTDTPARIKRTLGGSAANTAAWLAHEGCSVDFFARVGARDVLRCSEDFSEAGVTPHLAGDEELETGSLVSIVHGDDRSMLTDRGANTAFEPDQVLSLLIERAGSLGARVMVDASSAGFLSDIGPERFLNWVGGASILRCNEEEAHILGHSGDTREAIECLGQLFPRVIVTTGEDGALVLEDTVAHHIPATPEERKVDPTGAGDAFNAGVLAGLAAGLSLVDSGVNGSRLGAVAISQLGGRPSA